MNILITGTSSGLGKDIFNELKKDKKNFFFLINRKSKNNSKNVNNYKVSLSNHRLLKNKIKKIITDSSKRIDLIICNAAQGVFGYLDEIKMRLKVSQVVSKTVQLKKRGKEFIGLSPFKNEKSPSFTVNDEIEYYQVNNIC